MVLASAKDRAQLFDPDLEEGLRKPVDEALEGAGYERTDSARRGLMLACGASQLRRHQFGDCRQLTDASVPPAEGLSLPEHCFPDGIVYGVVVEGKVVSVAWCPRTFLVQGSIAEPTYGRSRVNCPFALCLLPSADIRNPSSESHVFTQIG